MKKFLHRFLALAALAMLFSAAGIKAQDSENYYFEDFEELSVLGPTKPTGWETGSGENPWGGFSMAFDKGIDGSQAFYANVGNADERWFYTHKMNLGSEPMVEFYYFAGGILGGGAEEGCMKVKVSVSTDDAATWTEVGEIAASEFTGSEAYTLKHFDLPAEYAHTECRIRVGAFIVDNKGGNLYLDNFAMGTGNGQTPGPGPNEPEEPQGPEIPEGCIALKPATGGNSLSRATPFSFTSTQHAVQVLYTAEQLNYAKGEILSLTYEGKFNANRSTNAKIYIGETEADGFEFDDSFNPVWFDPANMTKCFDGTIEFPEGDHQLLTLSLDEPYSYSGSKNLVIYTFNENEQPEDWENASGFYTAYSLNTASIYNSFYLDLLDVNQPEGGSMSFNNPNLTVIMRPAEGSNYTLGIKLLDQENRAIEDAVITLDGEAVQATYNQGVYSIANLPAKGYEYKISKTGYASIKGLLPLFKDTVYTMTMWNMEGVEGITDYIFEDFENTALNRKPFKWSNDFTVLENGGVNDSKRLAQNFWFFDGARSLQTAPVFMGKNPVFKFQYRVMELDLDLLQETENAFTGSNLSWYIQISTDLGKNWEIVYEEDYGTHTASTQYKTFSLDMSKYANEVCMFYLYVNRDDQQTDAFYFDIDNWEMGTRHEIDLQVLSPIKALRMAGSDQQNPVSVAVRNNGSKDAAGYTVKLFEGQNEVGSLTANDLLTAGSTVVHTFNYQSNKEGDFILTATVEAEGDEVAFNNTSNRHYLSAREEGSRGFNMTAYDGEDIYYLSPMSFYAPVSVSQILYPAAELDVKAGECITGMSLRTHFSKSLSQRRVTVYAGETLKGNLMAGENTGGNTYSLPAKEMQKVFEGELDFSTADGDNVVIPFDFPYMYTGKNLVICIYKQEVAASASWDDDMIFYGQFSIGYGSTIRHIYTTMDDAIDFNEVDMTEATNCFVYPATTFLSRNDIAMHKITFNVVNEDGEPIKGATVTFNGVAKAAGKYEVENVADGEYFYAVDLDGAHAEGRVTVNGADVTETVVLKGVANENHHSVMIRTFPNPCSGKLFVETASDAKEIGVYNIQGREVCKFNHVHAGTLEIDLSRERSGLYLLMIDGQAYKITKR